MLGGHFVNLPGSEHYGLALPTSWVPSTLRLRSDRMGISLECCYTSSWEALRSTVVVSFGGFTSRWTAIAFQSKATAISQSEWPVDGLGFWLPGSSSYICTIDHTWKPGVALTARRIVNVATTSLSSAQSLSQLAQGRICFVVAIVIWIIV